MEEHPLYRMWKDRLDTDLAREAERAARRAARDREMAAWYEAWREYKARARQVSDPPRKPSWWNLVGWVRWLLSLHAPGRPN
jgi:hypothetical protein